MQKVLQQIKEIGIVPVVSIDNADNAVELASAIANGGINCAEITFRTSAAKQCIENISQQMPDFLVGAGTVLTTQQADSAIGAGAKFMVSPGFNPTVVDHCIQNNYLIVPGCATPSDMEQAISRGLDVVKFFPAQQAGGIDYIKAVSAPYSSLSFMPTGGINADNLADYLSVSSIIACGGSWMVAKQLIQNQEYDKITELCKQAVEIVNSIK